MCSYKKPLQQNVMESLSHKNFSDETMKKVNWVRRMYNDWREFRNGNPNLQSINSNIEEFNHLKKDEFANNVCRFISEVKKVDGSDFPPRTLYDIVLCLQFWLESNGINWRLISDNEFTSVKYTVDNLMKQRAASGLGNIVRQAEVLTFTDEDLLWCLGLLGTHSPEVLVNTVVFMLGLSCSLRAGKEHRILRSIPFHSQFKFLYDNEGKMYLQYTEDVGLKTNKGGLKHRGVQQKVVEVYCSSNLERCPVRIFQFYLEKLPNN